MVLTSDMRQATHVYSDQSVNERARAAASVNAGLCVVCVRRNVYAGNSPMAPWVCFQLHVQVRVTRHTNPSVWNSFGVSRQAVGGRG
jgi:hypothetical protein